MTSVSHSIRFSPIGAFELKRTYQRNMFLGVVSVLLLFALLIGSVALIRVLTATDATNAPTIIIKSISELGPPPSVAKKQTQVKVTQEIAPPSFALPEAVPDEEVVEDFRVVSQEQLAEISSPVLNDGDGSGGNIIVDIPVEEYIPSPDEFVPYEEAPVPLKLASATYPPMAKKAGIEGEVWVKVLVDKSGEVRDAVIYIESGSNAGFEEAALEAAKKGKWKPAMQNKQPVTVWAAYKIEFKLSN